MSTVDEELNDFKDHHRLKNGALACAKCTGLLLAPSEVATFTVVPVQAYPLDSFAESII